MKRVLITGAAGFLGSHLCERFLNENFFPLKKSPYCSPVLNLKIFLSGDENATS